MTNAAIANAFSALGHETRLAIFRLLVRAGHEGMKVGEIGAALDMPASTLAHHLAGLVDAGLVLQERQGREVINRTDYEAVRHAISFLSEECCVDVKVGQETAA